MSTEMQPGANHPAPSTALANGADVLLAVDDESLSELLQSIVRAIAK